MNNVNQVSPYGNLTYTQDSWANGDPRYTATQSLSPQGQQLFDTNNQTQQNLANLAQQQSGRLSGILNQNLDFSSLPSAGSSPSYQTYGSGPSLSTQIGQSGDVQMQLGGEDSWGRVKDVENALFSRLNPQLDRQRQQLDTELVNKGIRPGSTAYQQQMETFNQGLNDQRTSVLLNAGQEQNRLQQLDLNSGNFANSAQAQQFGQQAARATFGNAANQQMYQNQTGATAANNALGQQQFANENLTRQNALNEMLLQRQLPLNEILALSGQAQLQQPSFMSTPQTSVGGTDVAGINANNYNQQMAQYQQNQGLLGGLFSAGASALPGLMALSDRRAKTDIKRIGTADNGLPLYFYRYRHTGVPAIGPMADEVALIHPDAVVMGPDGYARVDYEKAVL